MSNGGGNEAANERLAQLRRRIDEIDLEILGQINERTLVVEDIGKVKREHSLPIYEPKREDDVYRNVTVNNAGPLPPDAVRRIFERIIDEMRTVQRNRMLAEKDPARKDRSKQNNEAKPDAESATGSRSKSGPQVK